MILYARIPPPSPPQCRSQHQDVVFEEGVFDKLEIGSPFGRKSDKVKDTVKTHKPRILTTTGKRSNKCDMITQKLENQATGGKL